MTTFAELERVCRTRPPRIALILGSGWAPLLDRLDPVLPLNYQAIPGVEAATVPGHPGRAVLADWAGCRAVVFAGRLHGYEGHPQRNLTWQPHLARRLGCRGLVLTNAAGGIRADLAVGTLMPLCGHFAWTTPDAWKCCREGNSAAAWPNPYSPRWTEILVEVGREQGLDLRPGIYAQTTGPCYETRAEVRALQKCGADAVGMSTVPEAAAARPLGLECVALSCITNRACGLTAGPITHDHVVDAAADRLETLGRLLEGFLGKVGRE